MKDYALQAGQAARSLQSIWSFADEFLVVCPRCSSEAVVMPSTGTIPARLTCPSCGLARDWEASSPGVLTSSSATGWASGQYAIGDAADPYFHLPLWLQAPCRAHVLWAYNPRHLAFLRDYVAATDRRHPALAPGQSRNRLLASRLPRWIKLARNRQAVLRAIASLETAG